MYEPGTSEWWLIPPPPEGQAWPAFSLGKYRFDLVDRQQRGKAVLRAGFDVEKGMSKDALATRFSKSKRETLTLTDEWTWHAVVKDVQGGRLNDVFALWCKGGVSTPLVEIMTSNGPALEETVKAPKHLTLLAWNQDSERFTRVVAPNTRAISGTALANLGSSPTMKDLGATLGQMSADDFSWICLRFMVEFERTTSAEAADCWSTAMVWDRVLKELATWVR